MKLRTRLFLGFSALMTTALVGLLFGVFSVLQLARNQERLITENFAVVQVNQRLRKNLGEQMSLLLGATPQRDRLQQLQQDFQATLEQARAGAFDSADAAAFTRVGEDYRRFRQLVEAWVADSRQPVERVDQAFRVLREELVQMQQDAFDSIAGIERQSRTRALAVASLLGLVGFSVLLIGFLTAHSFARRFSEPIERLSRAADQVGRGNFEVSLPSSSIAELSLLIRRFARMTDSLRLLKETNVEALVQGQQRLQALLDSIDDGLLIIDQQGRLEHANPVAQRQLAWSSEHIGLTPGEALHTPALDEAVRQVLADQPVEGPQEDLVIEAGGETRLLAWRLSSVSHANGHTVGAVLVLHDVTSQRALERGRNEFVLRASHELRTPVTGMHMAFGLLRERLHFGPESRENDLLQTVDEEMRRLVRLINDMLNFSRYQSGQQRLELADCDVEVLLRRACCQHAAQAQQQGVDLQMELESPLPLLKLDRGQMERVLDNLLDNALRYTPSGGRIRLQARRHGERVIVSVEDTGEGIPYSQQSRIFEPFVQIGHKQGGAGLGLALCKEITRLHGGRLGVHSRLGQGTVFYLALPI